MPRFGVTFKFTTGEADGLGCPTCDFGFVVDSMFMRIQMLRMKAKWTWTKILSLLTPLMIV